MPTASTPAPVPGSHPFQVAAAAPGPGFGNWAGAPAVWADPDGGVVLAYRVRRSRTRGGATVLAHSVDGIAFTTVAEFAKERFGAESLERPAVFHDGARWHLWISCATPGTKHWRIDEVTAPTLAGLIHAEPVTIFPGDDRVGVKDPVVRRSGLGWCAWICCHPLDEPGEEDRMTTALATSADAETWSWRGDVLTPRLGTWFARGTRLTAVLDDGTVYFDGRATKEENFGERTGVAHLPTVAAARAPVGWSDGPTASLLVDDGGPIADVRYLDVLERPGHPTLTYYEAPLPDGSHELRVEPA